MADSDDDLPPPPKKVVLPSDSDDDLPPPPAKQAVVLPDSSDDDLPPPPAPAAAAPVKQVVLTSDDDDDLPPPPKPAAQTAAAAADDSESDDLPPPPGKSAAAASPSADAAPAPEAASVRTRSRHVDTSGAAGGGSDAAAAAGRKSRRQTTVRRSVNDISFEGFLFKQQPTWPKTSQKRWCILKGRVLTYFENQESHTPAGTLDLKGAKLVDVSKEAKMPNNFGLTGPSGQLKARTYIFAASNRDEYQQWINTLEQVLTEPKVSEIHWFDKMAQAIF